uniref:Deacetylase sirtuin-type domain-containing protein n=1 Tax=Spumella elongata TaxID=89044 RepID=A0A7S3HFZ4_9STRA|mmetsp:Transcript_50941/g.88880  ORF Transcript_50941/g.88880 Transcript_50941/m.88880 type:complete len:345 (+) Transcript_50941:28-1062(+)|eukprot:CAMPEP_0185008458 /NCGR_PEP_ID=MMETSP1098-20130426/89694_1 /TAXON_ID=89044 /ORGANISM="Spumella elongata, Strain CCAP 955/1" /LENGTH=344 /DNA_ID=CAMNT_0027536957 /DNA_START=27 /DNA_END=1061 /DNA_ORIENTATION=-
MKSFTCARNALTIAISNPQLRYFSAAGTQSYRGPLDGSAPLASPMQNEIEWLTTFFQQSKNVLVLTGAGISTSSGIPDYRGPNGSYKRGHKPMTHSEFMTSESSRKRFWARSMVGWQNVSDATPNNAHFALAKLEAAGRCAGVITQNVDRLHFKAGSTNVIDLHGRVDQVRCQCCKKPMPRNEWQYAMTSANASFMENMKQMQKEKKLQLDSAAAKNTNLRADGDAELNLEDYSMINVPSCGSCGGILKLDVVMFGDNVPADLVGRAYEHVDRCDSLLVVGTSLEVFSAYRFVRRAHQNSAKIAIVNYGETRAERDKLASIVFKSDANCAELLHEVANQVVGYK